MKIVLTAINAKFIHSSLAIRYLYAYAKEYQEFLYTVEYTINHQEDEILADLFEQKPDVICFSCYIWNISMVVSLAKNLKKILPNVKIVCGGPEVSYDCEEFLQQHSDIDVIIRGEGEVTFTRLVEALLNVSPLDEISGLSLCKGNSIFSTMQTQPLSLLELPFPYETLEGLEHRIIYYETQRGCPFHCQFCLSSVEKGVRFVPLETVYSQLDFFLEHKVKQVKFVDRSFNCNLTHSHGIWRYLIEHDNGITNFHMEIEAHLLTDETIALLKLARPHLFQFEIGIQSTNEQTLKAVERDADFSSLKERILQIQALGTIHIHLDLIAGLPYEGYASFRKSFNDVFVLGAEQLQMGFLKLLKGSGLHRNREKYHIEYREENPYEVLSTKDISYVELLQLKRIEELLELYYNGNKAIKTLQYVLPFFSSPFDFFEEFALFWVKNGHHKVKHKKEALYEILRKFLLQSDCVGKVTDIVEDMLKFDMLLHDNLSVLPQWAIASVDFEEFKSKKRDFFHNPTTKDKYFCGDLSNYSATQLSRMCRLEHFSCDVTKIPPTNEETVLLFNYYERDLLYNCAKVDVVSTLK